MAADPISTEALQASTERFEALQSRAQPLTQDGRFDEALAVFVDALPPDAGAVDYQALGNLHFRLNPDASRRFHRKALELAPGSRLASLELGYDLMAAKDPAAACPLLEHALSSEPRAPAFALLASCKLATQDVSGAIAAWKRTGFPKAHTRISSVLGEVYGPPSPWLLRKGHLEAARASKEWAPVVALLEHDVSFVFDWWNSAPQLVLLERDLAEFGTRVPPPQRRVYDAVVAALKTPEGKTALKALAKKPPDVDTLTLRSLVMVGLVSRALSEKDLSDVAMLSRKRARAKQATQTDVEFAATLAQLVRDEAALDELDAIGWQRFQSKACAQSYLLRKARDGQPAPLVPLADALARHPDSPFFHQLALDALPPGDSTARRARLIELARAEFQNLMLGGERGPRDPGGLDRIFRELEAGAAPP